MGLTAKGASPAVVGQSRRQPACGGIRPRPDQMAVVREWEGHCGFEPVLGGLLPSNMALDCHMGCFVRLDSDCERLIVINKFHHHGIRAGKPDSVPSRYELASRPIILKFRHHPSWIRN